MVKGRSKLKQLRRHPSLAVGLVLIAVLVGMSLYAIIAIPYSEAAMLWRGGPGVWDENPRNAEPVWLDLFTRDKLPRTIIVTLDEGTTTEEPIGAGMKQVKVVLPFQYDYDGFPSELQLLTGWRLEAEQPTVSVYWRKPDGQVIAVTEDRTVRRTDTYHISQDVNLRAALGGVAPHVGLFAPDHTTAPADRGEPLRGSYELILQTEISEQNELLEARLRVYGRVHGQAGTDHRRRDLMVALLWGTPATLLFGVLAALALQAGSLVLAAMGSRHRERIDPLFRRLTDMNMIPLALPLLIVIGWFLSPSRGVMLLALFVLSLLRAAIMVLRATFLPSGAAPQGGPARASGTMIALLLPSFLLAVPVFVFLDAALAMFGLADPVLPTWGKIINDAFTQGAIYKGYYYWIVQPAALLMVTAVGFSLAGYALHRIFNPRLKTEN